LRLRIHFTLFHVDRSSNDLTLGLPAEILATAIDSAPEINATIPLRRTNQ